MKVNKSNGNHGPSGIKSTVAPGALFCAGRRGHAYGHEEVLNHIRSTVAWLLPCIQAHDAQRGG